MFADLTAADTRIIGTHVSFDWLPTEVRTTPAGQQPRRVVCLVREPKENFVTAAVFGGGVEGIGPLVDAQVAAVKGTGSGETGVPSRGFAGFANGYAAAVGGEARGGPKVFLLSQARLADPSTVSAHVAELAKFLEVSDYADDEEHNAKTVQLAQSAIGDVSQMGAAKAALADEAFAAPHVDPRVTALYETAAAGAFNRSAGSSSASRKHLTPHHRHRHHPPPATVCSTGVSRFVGWAASHALRMAGHSRNTFTTTRTHARMA